jgi:hypothetical protein
MGKKLALFGLLICWPALASLVPLVPSDNNETPTVQDRSDWFASHLGPLGLTFSSQYRLVESVLPRDLKSGLLFEADEARPLSPPQSLNADREPAAISGETSPPGKLAFLVIILAGALIRFFTSATFHDFLMDVYSPLAPY